MWETLHSEAPTPQFPYGTARFHGNPAGRGLGDKSCARSRCAAGAQLPNSNDLITNKREIETTVLADNREILVLGGLISEDVQESVNKVPLLGDIPLLGRLFRSSAKSVKRRNLMIFLRATILRDALTTKDLSEEKFNLIKAKQILKEEEPETD